MAPKQKSAGKAKAEPKVVKPLGAAEEPAAKKAKTDEPEAAVDAEKKEEEPKEEEKPKEEEDAVSDARAPFKGSIGFETVETTPNVVVAAQGKVLMCLADGGIQYFIAGARANTAVTSGRYMYEVRLCEAPQPWEGGHGVRGPQPKQLVRVGFSTAGSSLLLGDGHDGVYFDSEGSYFANGKMSRGSAKRFTPNCIAALVLNLDPKTPFPNTVSLFINGERVSKPQPIPEELHGKPLFPHISYRNVTLHVHFGPEPFKALPFKCRTIQGAANSDLKKTAITPPADGKYEVLFPTAFPDQGTFPWLDDFLEKNPGYYELSERKLLQWAEKSGIYNSGKGKGKGSCTDKPHWNFHGLPIMEDQSVSWMMKRFAPLAPRNYVVMEVRDNLQAKFRGDHMKRFPAKYYKRIAHVVMGEPNKDWKEKVRNKLLKQKQDKLDHVHRQKMIEKERTKELERKAKEVEEKKKAAEQAREKARAERLQKVEEAKKKAMEAKAKAEADKKKAEGGEEKKDEEMKEEAKDGEAPKEEATETKEEKKEEPKEEAKEEPKEEPKEEDKKDEEEEEDKGPEQAALTEDDEKVWFLPPAQPDLRENMVDKCFANWSIPDKTEGFDAVKFEWQNEAGSKDYLKKWILERKRTSRVDLKPGEWFQTTQTEVTKKMTEWKNKQVEAKKKPAKEKKEDDEDVAPSIDIFTVENVCDIGDGEPLFLHFEPEDWALLALRYDLWLLAHGFKKDANDEDRVAIPEQHFWHYFGIYFRGKKLNLKSFAQDTLKGLCELIKDSAKLDGEPGMFSSDRGEDSPLDDILKSTEDKRRERQRRIDAGDETARLPFKF